MPGIPGLFVELDQTSGAGHQQIVGLLYHVAVGHAAPVGVVILAGTGVDEDFDLTISGDIGERIRHLVVCPPIPHQAAAVGVALHEQDSVVGELEPIVRVPVVVLAISGPLGHSAASFPERYM